MKLFFLVRKRCLKRRQVRGLGGGGDGGHEAKQVGAALVDGVRANMGWGGGLKQHMGWAGRAVMGGGAGVMYAVGGFSGAGVGGRRDVWGAGGGVQKG